MKEMKEIRVYGTKRRMEDDTEYFEAEDDQETKFETNQHEEQGDFEELVRGIELIDDEIDTTKAYQFFRRLEETSREDNIRVLESQGGLMAPSSAELPSTRMARLK